MPSYLRRAFVLPLTWKSPTALQSKSDTVSDSPVLRVCLRQRQLWKKAGCWVHILVVENDVGLPDHLGRNTESLNAVIFHGVPTQFIIIPDLQEIGVSLKNSSLTSNMLILCWFNQRRQWQPTPVLLPGKSHGWRSLIGCSPWGREESDRTERLHFHFSLSCIGQGHGKPLQCSCLENPRDGGAWWAAIYGVTQGRTQLKRLGSSSSGILVQQFFEKVFI